MGNVERNIREKHGHPLLVCLTQAIIIKKPIKKPSKSLDTHS